MNVCTCAYIRTRNAFYIYTQTYIRIHTNRFVLITDPAVPSLRECLKQIYTHIYVEHVIKNPVCICMCIRDICACNQESGMYLNVHKRYMCM